MPFNSCAIPTYRYILCDGLPDGENYPSNMTPLSADDCYSISASHLVRLFTNGLQDSFNNLTLDLLTIASAVFIADCRSSRSQGALKVHGWRRIIEVTIPIRLPDHWNMPEVKRSLQDALNFVTGDAWTFNFATYSGIQPDKRLFLPLNQDSRICLFSEGLDSLCGLTYQLSFDRNAQFTAITASIQKQAGKRVKEAVADLNQLYKNRVRQVFVPLQRRQVSRNFREDGHQRSRSFLLLSIACVAALASGSNQVEVYENGIEAFNFPFEEGVLDAQVSRAMHPVFLSLMTTFITTLTNAKFRFLEPFLFHTKRDMVAMLGDSPSRALVARTISCMHFPIREKGPKQCGSCENCILRRVALFDTFWADEPYRRHFLHPVSSDFTHMQMQMFQIRTALRQTDPIAALLRASGLSRIHRDELLNAATQAGECLPTKAGGYLRDLFARHEEQWTAYISKAERVNGLAIISAQNLINSNK